MYRKLFLTASKEKAYKNEYNRPFLQSGCDYEIFDNATIYPRIQVNSICAFGGVITKDGKYVSESVNSEYDYKIFDIKKCGCNEYQEKTVVYLGADLNHWGHFLVNVVPRLWIVNKIKVDKFIISRDYNYDNCECLDNEYRFLTCLGIEKQVEFINRPIKYERVIVPKPSYFSYEGQDKTYCAYLNDEYLRTIGKVVSSLEINAPKRNDKYLLSRYNTGEAGIELVENFFQKNGFKIIYPEKMGLKELVEALRSSDTVAYLSGTLQHNMLFAPQGIKTICIERRAYISSCQIDIDKIMDLNVTYVDATYNIFLTESESGAFFWTKQFEAFCNEFGMTAIDTLYASSANLKRTIDKYARLTMWWPEGSLFEKYKLATYVYDSILENIQEVIEQGIDIQSINREELIDDEKRKKYIEEYLFRNNIPYCMWQEGDYYTFANTARKIIEKALEFGEELLLYPFGVNGMLIYLMLKEQYGILPKAIFDNKISLYRNDVFNLKFIKEYLSENSVVILTTCKKDCMLELQKYVDIRNVISPYRVI